jgi:23S rRNA (cytosine1962-C5)-methyltransferase
MTNMEKRVFLLRGKEQPLLRRHPWIFSGAVHRTEGDPQDGDRVSVCDVAGHVLGWGHYHEGSIRVKLIHMGGDPPGDAVFRVALEEAWALRRALGFGPQGLTTGYRLVHGEGDQLPGLIVDVYGSLAILQAHTIGMHREREMLAAALMALPDLGIHAVYDRSSRTLPPAYALTVRDGFLVGGAEGEQPFLEEGLQFQADWAAGQKTGFFLDQRENRSLLGRYAPGRSVLNTFCYTGGFSLYALRAGASRVDSVDVSARALSILEEHIRLNAPDPSVHQSHQAEVSPFLRQQSDRWDIVILDPPAFAKSINKRHQAVQGYKRLNAEGMARVQSGGLLFTFSCSQVVDARLFRDTVLAAALEAGKRARILHVLSQGPDHPVNLALPETSYLKGLVLEIRD